MSIQIYGKNPCQEILESKKTVLKAFVINDTNHDLVTLIQKKQIPLTFFPKGVFSSKFEGNHQGIVLEIPDYPVLSIEQAIAKVKDKPLPFFVMLDGLVDPHNFGAIIRTAEAAGVDGIIFPKNRSVGITGTVAKVSSGAIEHIDLIEVTNLNQTIEKLKKERFWVVGTDLEAPKDYTEIFVDTPLVLVIGNEGKGVSRLVKTNVDYNVTIPMAGKTNSLNASVSAGIIIFDVVRRKRLL